MTGYIFHISVHHGTSRIFHENWYSFVATVSLQSTSLNLVQLQPQLVHQLDVHFFQGISILQAMLHGDSSKGTWNIHSVPKVRENSFLQKKLNYIKLICLWRSQEKIMSKHKTLPAMNVQYFTPDGLNLPSMQPPSILPLDVVATQLIYSFELLDKYLSYKVDRVGPIIWSEQNKIKMIHHFFESHDEFFLICQ